MKRKAPTQSNKLICAFILVLCSVLSVSTRADSENFGEYTVHYIAVNSTFINADIAAQYGIRRGDRRAFLNISVLKNNPDGSTTPVTATLKGGKKNLLAQTSDIDFLEVREGEAIYYIGQFDFSNAENLRFDVEVQPESTGRTYNIEWTTQLYIN